MKKADGPGKAISERKAVGEQELAEQAARKRLMEMNLLDDFLFGSIVSYLVMVYTVKTSVWKNREWSMRMGQVRCFCIQKEKWRAE